MSSTLRQAYSAYFTDVNNIHKLKEKAKQEKERNDENELIKYRLWKTKDVLGVVAKLSYSITLSMSSFAILSSLSLVFTPWWYIPFALFLTTGLLIDFLLHKPTWYSKAVIDIMTKKMIPDNTYVELYQKRKFADIATLIQEQPFTECLDKLNLPESTDEFTEDRVKIISVSSGKLFVDKDFSYENNIAIDLDLLITYRLNEIEKEGSMNLVFVSRHPDAFESAFSGQGVITHQVIIEGLMYIFLCATSPKYQACVFLKQEKDGSFVDIASCY